MGRVRTAAAKKYIESSDEDENLASKSRSARSKKDVTKKYMEGIVSNGDENLPSKSRSTRSKKDTTNKNQKPKTDTPIRSSRSTRNSETNGKANERNEKNDKNGKLGSDFSSSESELEIEAPAVTRKRKASNETKIAKKSKPSTSATPSKNKLSQDKPKSTHPKKMKKNKVEVERYEVEEILDHKIENNTKYFLIRWKGYDSSADSWERQHNISCPALVAKYYEEHPEASISANHNKKKKKPTVPKPRTLKIDEQLDYDSDWNENEDYEVERILDVYLHRNNKRDFLIRWKGYSSKSDSWEPEDNLDCKELIEKFMEKVDQLKNVSQKDLRPIRSQTQRFTLMTQASARRLSKRNFGKQRAVYYDCDE